MSVREEKNFERVAIEANMEMRGSEISSFSC